MGHKSTPGWGVNQEATGPNKREQGKTHFEVLGTKGHEAVSAKLETLEKICFVTPCFLFAKQNMSDLLFPSCREALVPGGGSGPDGGVSLLHHDAAEVQLQAP